MHRNLITLTILMLIFTGLPVSRAQEASAAFPITVTDATGTQVTIESLDAIVSGSGDVTEIIHALGFYENLVGVDATSTYPAEALQEKVEIGFSRRLTETYRRTQSDGVFLHRNLRAAGCSGAGTNARNPGGDCAGCGGRRSASAFPKNRNRLSGARCSRTGRGTR
ncbi:MAG TPA: hypothetical protein VJZ27_17785, partial [Aggregatilineales bacterium]|nr:hypothetical protein [Aggregatilineales bacterium]